MRSSKLRWFVFVASVLIVGSMSACKCGSSDDEENGKSRRHRRHREVEAGAMHPTIDKKTLRRFLRDGGDRDALYEPLPEFMGDSGATH